MKTRCRHYKAWVAGLMEWCYECGAFRSLVLRDGNLCADSTWCRPVGKNGEDPWYGWVSASRAMKRMRNENQKKVRDD